MIEQWHKVVASKDPGLLDDLLAEDVVFFSPVLHKAMHGKEMTKFYLTGAMHVLLNDQFEYTKQVINESAAVLEFVTTIDEIVINGVDIISWNSEGKIIEFKVMARPKKGLEKLQEEMWKLLQKMS